MGFFDNLLDFVDAFVDGYNKAKNDYDYDDED